MLRHGLLVVILITAFLAPTAQAAPIPSTSEPATASSTGEVSPADLSSRLFDNREIAGALEEYGLTDAQVEDRLAQLSQQDLRYLSSNLDQVQAAGRVPEYIWILLGIFLGVLILGAIF